MQYDAAQCKTSRGHDQFCCWCKKRRFQMVNFLHKAQAFNEDIKKQWFTEKTMRIMMINKGCSNAQAFLLRRCVFVR